MENINKKNVLNTVLTIVKWIVSLFFLICLIGVLSDKAYLSAILLLLAVVLLVPPLTNFWRSKIPFLSNRFIKGALLIILFFAGILTNPAIGNHSKRANSQPKEKIKTEEKEPLVHEEKAKAPDEQKLDELNIYFKERNTDLCTIYKVLYDLEGKAIKQADNKYPDFGIKHSEYFEELYEVEKVKVFKKYKIHDSLSSTISVFGTIYCQ